MRRTATAEDDDPDDDDDWSGASDDAETNTFPCPSCKREVYDGAEQCPYCKRYITDEDDEQREHPHPPWIMATAIVLLILFGIGAFAIF